MSLFGTVFGVVDVFGAVFDDSGAAPTVTVLAVGEDLLRAAAAVDDTLA